jgi:hypothetical protein
MWFGRVRHRECSDLLGDRQVVVASHATITVVASILWAASLLTDLEFTFNLQSPFVQSSHTRMRLTRAVARDAWWSSCLIPFLLATNWEDEQCTCVYLSIERVYIYQL